MSDSFAYARATPGSMPSASTELRKAAAAAGHMVSSDNTVIETLVTSVALSARPDWQELLDRMYEGDVLVVLTLGDLGRDVKEVCATVQCLAARGLRVHCLGLDRVDLASPAGRSTMNVLAAVADFDDKQRAERERIGTKSNKTSPLVRRKGRPPSLSRTQITEARRLLATGVSTVQIARRLGTSRQTIMRAYRREAQTHSIAATLRPSV